MSKKFDIAVPGGGIVGHTLALLLARDRWRVALVCGRWRTSARTNCCTPKQPHPIHCT